MKCYWRYAAIIAIIPWVIFIRAEWGGNLAGGNDAKREVESEMARMEAKLTPRQLKKKEFDAKFKPKSL